MNHDKQNRLNDLRKELSSLNARRQDIMQEIAEIEKVISKTKRNVSSFSNSSSVADKIKCFRNLFQGRNDVYARHFESIKTGDIYRLR